MLDEALEYSMYLTKGYGGLIQKDNINDSLKGIRRILTVLARGFLEQCLREGISDLESQHRYTVSFLKVWLAGPLVSELNDGSLNAALEELSEYPDINRQIALAKEANLLDYAIESKVSFDKKVKFDKAVCKKSMKRKLKDWDKTMFPAGNGSSFNAVYFKVIVADALEAGPLESKTLRIRADEPKYFGLYGNFEDDKKSCEKSGKRKYYRNNSDKLRETRLAFIFAIVATYLQYKTEDCENVPVVWADISNYVGKPCNKDAKKVFGSVVPFIEKAGFEYRGRPLFIKQRIKDTFNKLTVNPAWIRDYDVHLAPADSPLPEGYLSFNDKQLCGIYQK